MTKKSKKVPFVEVRWWDAHSVDAWVTEDQFPKLAPIITRGWLVQATADTLVVAGSIAPEDEHEQTQYGEIIAIPKAWAKVKRLRK